MTTVGVLCLLLWFSDTGREQLAVHKYWRASSRLLRMLHLKREKPLKFLLLLEQWLF